MEQETETPMADSAETARPMFSGAAPCYVAKELDRFRVPELNCDGWIVPPCVEDALKNLCKKHNELVEFLSTGSITIDYQGNLP